MRVLEAPYNAKAGYAVPKRATIGRLCSDSATEMYPASNYMKFYPKEWEALTGQRVNPQVKKLGMYALVNAVNTKVGIIDTLAEVFGEEKANSITDFAMYSILFQSSASSEFETRMSGQMLFGGDPKSDTYYSELFEKKLTRGEIHAFRKAWALRCRDDGVDDVWLCIDGSNNDCSSIGVELAEQGHNKSKTNRNIVSFTYAVAQDGRPVTFEVYRGGLVDAKAMRMIIDFLMECGIRVKGVILDRGYCNAPALRYLEREGLEYVIMVKGRPQGVDEIMAEFASKIKMNAEYLIEGTALFGIQKKCQLFKNYAKEDYLTLYFDFVNASGRIETLLNNLYAAMNDAKKNISDGKEPAIPPQYAKVLLITGEGTERIVTIVSEKLQEMMDEKGLSCIVTSKEMGPKEVNHMYVTRNSSEKQYKIVKADLGYGVVRVYETAGVYSKFTVGFISSAIRFEIQKACEDVCKSTTHLINEMNKLEMTKTNETYVYTHTENKREEDVLRHLNTSTAIFDEIAKDENDRLAGRHPTPRHRKPGPKKISKAKASNTEKKKPGPKPGFTRSNVNLDGSLRKKPGPKPGFTRGEYNKDGSLRQKPGPKPGSHRKPTN